MERVDVAVVALAVAFVAAQIVAELEVVFGSLAVEN